MNHLNKISCQGTTVMKFFGGFFSVTPAAPLTEIRSQQRRSLSPEAFNYHITKKSEHTPLVRNVNKSWHHAGYTGRGAVKKWALLEFGQIPSVHTAKNIRRVKICDTVSGSEILFSLTEVKKKEEKKSNSRRVGQIHVFASSQTALFSGDQRRDLSSSCFVLMTDSSRKCQKILL